MKSQDRNTGLLKHWLADQLHNDIRKGLYRPGEFLEPIRQLCTKFEVSHITVQAALRDLERQGVVERHSRKGILVKESRMDGETCDQLVFLRWNASIAFTEQVEGAQRYCQQMGLSLTVLDAGQSHERMFGYMRDLPVGTRGVMLVPFVTPAYAEAIRTLQDTGVPVVCLVNHVPGAEASSVVLDDFSCGCLAVNHIMEQADRPVWYLGYKERRHAGWAAAMHEHGVDDVGKYERIFDISEDVLLTESVHRITDIGEKLAGKLFKEKNPDGGGWSIFTFNDHCARGVYLAAKKAGLEIGKDVLVVGAGDYPFATRLHPSLSSMVMSRQILGYNGAKLLHGLVTQQGPRVSEEILPVHLVARGSSLGSEDNVKKESVFSTSLAGVTAG